MSNIQEFPLKIPVQCYFALHSGAYCCIPRFAKMVEGTVYDTSICNIKQPELEPCVCVFVT